LQKEDTKYLTLGKIHGKILKEDYGRKEN